MTEVPGISDEEANEIVAKHKSNGRRLCYAKSLGPILIKHSGGGVRMTTLRCTLPLNHDERLHRDANCCWTPHTFVPDMAGDPEPEHYNWEVCVECHHFWPCDVAKLGTMWKA